MFSNHKVTGFWGVLEHFVWHAELVKTALPKTQSLSVSSARPSRVVPGRAPRRENLQQISGRWRCTADLQKTKRSCLCGLSSDALTVQKTCWSVWFVFVCSYDGPNISRLHPTSHLMTAWFAPNRRIEPVKIQHGCDYHWCTHEQVLVTHSAQLERSWQHYYYGKGHSKLLVWPFPFSFFFFLFKQS